MASSPSTSVAGSVSGSGALGAAPLGVLPQGCYVASGQVPVGQWQQGVASSAGTTASSPTSPSIRPQIPAVHAWQMQSGSYTSQPQTGRSPQHAPQMYASPGNTATWPP